MRGNSGGACAMQKQNENELSRLRERRRVRAGSAQRKDAKMRAVRQPAVQRFDYSDDPAMLERVRITIAHRHSTKK